MRTNRKREPAPAPPPTSMASRRASRARAARSGRAPGTTLDMGGLEGAIGFALRRAQIAVFDHYSELTQGLGVTPAQFAALSLIQANPGLNQVSLGEALCIEGPRTAVVIDDLERRGLVTRKAAPADRRSHAIFLTPAGRSLHKKVAKREAEHNAHMIERLRGEDKDALLRMLRLLATPF